MGKQHKQYTLQAKISIKGEAFFETLISDYSLPHHIVGPKDIGIDYICEWVYGDKPTGFLYIVQVKTFSENPDEPSRSPKEEIGENRLNGLDEYTIRNSNLKIDERTRNYWRGFGVPAYLFVVHRRGSDELNCYYKRFTSILTDETEEQGYESTPFKGFYKVNNGSKFRAFSDPEKRTGGFARDLYIDHVRWSYYKGSIAFLSPDKIGLRFLPQDLKRGNPIIFEELFEKYEGQIKFVYKTTEQYLEYLEKRKEKQPYRLGESVTELSTVGSANSETRTIEPEDEIS